MRPINKYNFEDFPINRPLLRNTAIEWHRDGLSGLPPSSSLAPVPPIESSKRNSLFTREPLINQRLRGLNDLAGVQNIIWIQRCL